MNQLPALAGMFAYLSLVTFGGGMAAFPELKTIAVEQEHWLNFSQLIHFFSVGQAAPGPKMMMVVTIGQHVSGPLGALVAFVAYLAPTSILAFGVARIWARLEKWRWRNAIQRGLAPVAIGLILAGAISLARGALESWVDAAISASVFALLLRTKVSPALVVLGGAMVGALVFKFG